MGNNHNQPKPRSTLNGGRGVLEEREKSLNAFQMARRIADASKVYGVPVRKLFTIVATDQKGAPLSKADAKAVAQISKNLFSNRRRKKSSEDLTRGVLVFAEMLKKTNDPQQFLRGLDATVPQRSAPLLGGKGRGGIANEMSLSE